MSEPDSAGSNRELHAAAQRSVLGWASASQVIENQVLIAVGERPSVLFWRYYMHYSTIILLLFYYYSDYFTYYMHYTQNRNDVAGEYSLLKFATKLARGAEPAGEHRCDGVHPQSSSSTTTLPCPMDGPDASSPGSAAYAALMYFSQPSRMTWRKRGPKLSTSWAMASSLFCYTWSARPNSARTWKVRIISIIRIIHIIICTIGIIHIIKQYI